MGWFKKKQTCVHCNTNKTKRDLEGHSTCAECRVKILMGRESKRLCPVDGSTLIKSTKNELILDRCPKCQGIWLDAGELKAIEDMAKQEGMAVGMVVF